MPVRSNDAKELQKPTPAFHVQRGLNSLEKVVGLATAQIFLHALVKCALSTLPMTCQGAFLKTRLSTAISQKCYKFVSRCHGNMVKAQFVILFP